MELNLAIKKFKELKVNENRIKVIEELKRLNSDVKELILDDKLHFFEYVLDKKELVNYLQSLIQFKNKYKL